MVSVYDFLLDSLLFADDRLADEYGRESDDELGAELQRYREFCLTNQVALVQGTTEPQSRLTVMPSLASNRPGLLHQLKQTALYLDRQIIDDPLFRLSAEPGEMSQAMSDYLGISTTRVDRAEIAAAVRFLKELTPMYVCGYVRILPLSNQFEPPAAIPLTISATQYRELLPPEVLRWIRYHALIAPVEVREGQMHVFKPSKQPPPPRRMIHIQFDPSDPSQGQGFNLLLAAVVNLTVVAGENLTLGILF